MFRTIFAQPDPDTVASTWDQLRDQLGDRFPKIATLMDGAKTEARVQRLPALRVQFFLRTRPASRSALRTSDGRTSGSERDHDSRRHHDI